MEAKIIEFFPPTVLHCINVNLIKIFDRGQCAGHRSVLNLKQLNFTDN